jgi:hypothetical protein
LRAEKSGREVEGDGRFGGEGMATLPHRFAQAPAPHKGERLFSLFFLSLSLSLSSLTAKLLQVDWSHDSCIMNAGDLI